MGANEGVVRATHEEVTLMFLTLAAFSSSSLPSLLHVDTLP
jgi:hypothetical protein